MNTTRLLIWALLILSARSAVAQRYHNPYSSLQTLQSCLSGVSQYAGTPLGDGTTECVLAAGTYPTSTDQAAGYLNVEFTKSNYTLVGTYNSTIWDTTLIRVFNVPGNPGGVASLIYVAPGLNHINVRNIGINGNRFQYQWTGFTWAPSNPDAGPGDATGGDGWGCPTYDASSNYEYIDVDLLNATIANIGNVTVANSPGSGIRILNGSVTLQTIVRSARTTGLLLGGDTAGPFGGNASVDSSQFYMNGTAGVTILGTSQLITNNTLMGNRYEQPDGYPGGQLTMYMPSSGVGGPIGAMVYGNDGNGTLQQVLACFSIPGIDGTTGNLSGTSCPTHYTLSLQGVDGIEVDGTGHSILGNWVDNHSGTGVLVHPTASTVTLGGINPQNQLGGIILYNQWGVHVIGASAITIDQVWIECNNVFFIPTNGLKPYGISVDSNTT